MEITTNSVSFILYDILPVELKIDVQCFVDWKTIIALSQCSKKQRHIYEKYMPEVMSTKIVRYLIDKYWDSEVTCDGCDYVFDIAKPLSLRNKMKIKYYLKLDTRAINLWSNKINSDKNNINKILDCCVGNAPCYELCRKFMLYYLSSDCGQKVRTVSINKLGYFFKSFGLFEYGGPTYDDTCMRILSIITFNGFVGNAVMDVSYPKNDHYYVGICAYEGCYTFFMKKNYKIKQKLFKWSDDKGFYYGDLCNKNFAEFVNLLAEHFETPYATEYDFIDNMHKWFTQNFDRKFYYCIDMF